MAWYDGMFNIPIDIMQGYGDKTRNRRRLGKFKDNITFQVNFAEQCELAENRYDIEGLPDTISKRVILQSLLWHASVVFFKKNDNIFALPGIATDEFNVYGEPGYAEVFSLNGKFNEKVKLYIPGTDMDEFLKAYSLSGITNNEEPVGVILWENRERYPYINRVMDVSLAIADTYRTLDICRANIKNPQIFYGEESMKDTVERYLEMRESNATAGYISTGVLEADKLKMIPFDPKGTSLSDVTSLIEWYENKQKERNGIKNNAQMDKKGENLIEAEVDVNDEATKKNSSDLVDYLNEGLEIVNEFTGLNLKAVEKGGMENDDLLGDGGEGSGDVSAVGGRRDEADDI